MHLQVRHIIVRILTVEQQKEYVVAAHFEFVGLDEGAELLPDVVGVLVVEGQPQENDGHAEVGNRKIRNLVFTDLRLEVDVLPERVVLLGGVD